VVRAPAEEPPPLTDYGWKLWQAGEAVDEWREDLRTLYVGCTRAEDYLVLSASVAADLRPEGPWLRLLAERFDLRSGRCLVAGIAPERTPAVRVMEEVPEAPLTAVNKPAAAITMPTGGKRTISRAPGVHGTEPASWNIEDESDLNEWLPSTVP